MAWFSGSNTWGNFPDLAGAVNKLQESVKNIEKNFDSALGFDEKSESSNEGAGSRPIATDKKRLFNPVMTFMGNNSEESTEKTSGQPESSQQKPVSEDVKEKTEPLDHPTITEGKEGVVNDNSEESTEKTSGQPESSQQKPVSEDVTEKTEPLDHPTITEGKEGVVNDNEAHTETEEIASGEEKKVIAVEEGDKLIESENGTIMQKSDHEKEGNQLPAMPADSSEPTIQNVERSVSVDSPEENEIGEVETTASLVPVQLKPVHLGQDQVDGSLSEQSESHAVTDVQDNFQVKTEEERKEERVQEEAIMEQVPPVQPEESGNSKGGDETKSPVLHSVATEETDSIDQSHDEHLNNVSPQNESFNVPPTLGLHENEAILRAIEGDHVVNDVETDKKEQHFSSVTDKSDSDSLLELEKVKSEMKMMETALQGAARQAQAKADEIARLMSENEHLKAMIEDLKRKSNEAEVESLREEYHQKAANLERKLYALTKERDTLRREQNKRSDAAALLKEKDEIITQVMAEGEELSKKQAAQEATIRKLRAQTRELEEEKKGLTTKLQVEENKVESIKRDKLATEKLLQETIEKHQTELAAQKEYYSNALAAAKEAEALAEARANTEARTELESQLRESEERESMLVQALEELRQTLSRREQQAVFKEDMLRRDIEDLQNRYQASERRCEELVTQVPESTRPLLRQIEAMQETNARRAEAWAAVERTLNSRLQEAEAKAAAAEERERSTNERLSQTLSRINVLEAQISCLRAEQNQLSRSLEKERQRAAENRQEYLASKEEADTQEGHVRQLEDEIRELRQKHKQELQEALIQRELLQQEIDKERAARVDLERTARDYSPRMKKFSASENGNLSRKVSSASSLGSMEESFFLQASLDSSDSFSERRNPGEPSMSPYYMKSMTPNAFAAALRQKEGEIASYMSRLASMESIRDSLAEELVKMTGQCEKLRVEAGTLPGLRAELEALRKRHSAALELMGERDEELEELRADIVDLKEMYREQVNLLVNKIQRMDPSAASV